MSDCWSITQSQRWKELLHDMICSTACQQMKLPIGSRLYVSVDGHCWVLYTMVEADAFSQNVGEK